MNLFGRASGRNSSDEAADATPIPVVPTSNGIPRPLRSIFRRPSLKKLKTEVSNVDLHILPTQRKAYKRWINFHLHGM